MSPVVLIDECPSNFWTAFKLPRGVTEHTLAGGVPGLQAPLGVVEAPELRSAPCGGLSRLGAREFGCVDCGDLSEAEHRCGALPAVPPPAQAQARSAKARLVMAAIAPLRSGSTLRGA